ncbi:MAG TPA: GTPase ObgE [Candidatus Binatia bacterium]|nr:GTPase ObgE [Candidatus Binatia bacterium]
MKFIDEVAITVAAGRGGDGVVAWRREKYVPKGGPAGGDGGSGGDVYLEAVPELGTLIDFRHRRSFAAESGKAGSTSNKSGRSGEDLVVRVPLGTLVYRRPLDDDVLEGETGGERLVADLSNPGERFLIAHGGRGGLGNQHFATSARQAPRFAEKGEPGERYALRLELKLLADCGLVGMPNAGKSTLLSVVSAARPKIADYPFTTLEPQLGVVRIDEEASFVMVDIPGLIEGAHEGAGLGDRFLRHIERTRILVHLIDGAKTRDEIVTERATIEAELRAWNPALLERPRLLVITKIDVPLARERFEELRLEWPGLRGISAATGEGVRELMNDVWRTIESIPRPAVAVPDPAHILLRADEPFDVKIEDGVFVVSGERIERLAAMTDFDSDEALARFEHVLNRMGVERRLRELGVHDGATVRIAGNEFTYS